MTAATRCKELAAELGVTQPTLRRCLDKLIEEGLIEVERAERFGAYRYYMPWRPVRLSASLIRWRNTIRHEHSTEFLCCG